MSNFKCIKTECLYSCVDHCKKKSVDPSVSTPAQINKHKVDLMVERARRLRRTGQR